MCDIISRAQDSLASAGPSQYEIIGEMITEINRLREEVSGLKEQVSNAGWAADYARNQMEVHENTWR